MWGDILWPAEETGASSEPALAWVSFSPNFASCFLSSGCVSSSVCDRKSSSPLACRYFFFLFSFLCSWSSFGQVTPCGPRGGSVIRARRKRGSVCFIWGAEVSRNAPLCCEAEGFLNSGLSHQSSQLRMSKRSEGRLRAPWPFFQILSVCPHSSLGSSTCKNSRNTDKTHEF